MRAAPTDRIEPTAGGAAVCYSWPDVLDAGRVIAVSCYTPDGRPIRCCGHGLLAAAHGWQRYLDCDELTLLMHGSRVMSWRRNGCTWLRFRRVPTRPCPVPSWVPALFPGRPQPIAAATCGDERGYLVLQWPDDVDLRDLPRPGSRLSVTTRRALVCTSAQPATGANAIQLRYFAPQYGVLEDDATGSAMRVLADFWSARFDCLAARQRSPAGGELLARLASGYVDVGGRCVAMAGAARG